MNTLTLQGRSIEQWCQSHPLLKRLILTEPLCWINPQLAPFADVKAKLPLGPDDIADAAARLDRFAPYLAKVFPETAAAQGLIESPLIKIPQAQAALASRLSVTLPGTLMLKCDNQLPISGSVKARGGIYEVLKHAECLALTAGLLSCESDYRTLDGDACRALFGQHQIVVGSTGNLGLSIGIVGAKFGFNVTVHMSADAKPWKKALLRSKGVTVVEHQADYSKAVEQGRLEAQQTARCHFVDDENSRDLFLGYSVAAQRLKKQLDQQGVMVDAQHPLFVYLPCGVGGGPGGVAFGLKQLFGDNVHCFFAEPTHSPCMLLGMYTGLHDRISVQELGIDNKTCADGLAVGRASAFVGGLMEPLLDGIYTVDDETLYRLLVLVKDHEGIELEPSALAGVVGIIRIIQECAAGGSNENVNPTVRGVDTYLQRTGLADKLSQATHIAWATGGNMVPESERQRDYQTGLRLL
ncbi:MAG: D-serine ammonia-lyase [Motiliproteus sp.]